MASFPWIVPASFGRIQAADSPGFGGRLHGVADQTGVPASGTRCAGAAASTRAWAVGAAVQRAQPRAREIDEKVLDFLASFSSSKLALVGPESEPTVCPGAEEQTLRDGGEHADFVHSELVDDGVQSVAGLRGWLLPRRLSGSCHGGGGRCMRSGSEGVDGGSPRSGYSRAKTRPLGSADKSTVLPVNACSEAVVFMRTKRCPSDTPE